MRSRISSVWIPLTLTSSLWAQAPLEPASPPSDREPQKCVQMPAPTPIDVAVDDSVPFDGEAVVGTNDDGSPQVQKGTESPLYLGFASQRYYPAADERVDPKLLSEVRLDPTDGRPQPTSYAFVMFSKRITKARLATLESLGARVLGFHPGYCMKVALPPQEIDTIGALDFVRWIGAPRAAQKVHPSLSARAAAQQDGEALEMIVNVYESDLCAATTRELLATGEQLDVESQITPGADERNAAYRVHSNGWQQHALEALGLEVAYYTEKDSVRAFHVRAPAAAIESLVALDFVQFVEEEPQAGPHHDESMPLVNADSSRQSYTGGTNYVVVGGEIDSGISPGHSDLYYHLNGWGWDFSGSGTGAWYDGCGHGTHVAGTITGDGTSSYKERGVAPGLGWGANGRFQLSKIFSGCGTQTVNLASVMGVMRAGSWDNGGSYTPRSHVINNSWGSGPTSGGWIGSEYESRLVDDEVYWQQQMYVFSAGNDTVASSVSQEAGAKNAFAVGSVDDSASWGTGPGVRSSFSSQGPMADGRFKPNVCAPGDWIRSLQANTWNSYTSMSGTSMASPHVTGTAAQLCDQYSWLRYNPAGLASVLMASAVTRGAQPILSQFTTGLNQYGTGRIDSFLATLGTYETGWSNWVFDLGAGQGTYADFYVNPGTTRIVVCMTWTEVAASAGASKAANNDWDLYIDYEPFSSQLNVGEYNAGVSSVNNTEIRYIDNPPVGWFRWKLNPYNAPGSGHFGVTVFFVSGATQPNASLSLTQNTSITAPGLPVTMTASVYTNGYLASGAWVDSSGGNYLNASYKYLNDGGFADMSGARKMTLGNILSYNSRTAYYEPVWWSDGYYPFSVTSHTDNGADAVATNYVWVDGTPPTTVPYLQSSSHAVGIWQCDSTVYTDWGAASDATIGVAGYSVEWNDQPTWDPDGLLDTYGQSWSQALADSVYPYYFHVRAIDWAGNVGATTTFGPIYIWSEGGQHYCSGKLNSQFCSPYMTWTGHLGATGADDLHLQANQILNNKTGLLFWGNGSSYTPFQGGTKCVANPVVRSATMNSGGSPSGNNCTGSFDFHFSRAYVSNYFGLAPGDVFYTQFWSRDPADPFHTSLTDAVAVIVCN